MPLSVGDLLGPYEILAAIGKGGMGEVYSARDTKLNRDIAIKILPENFARDHERVARFKREARVLASLNHPNIATLHGLEESDGTPALVMELVEGPTLAERIAAGPMPLEDAIPIALQIIEALDFAHDRGVIHRDLKPANVKMTPEGKVKLLDFGLAKALGDELESAPSQDSPTATMGHTRAGVILGTAAYMSPEQLKGKRADRRADIWAFGVVLYEMLTGKPLFGGETTAEILSSVMQDQPPLADVPAVVRPLLARCLEKNPRQRLQAIGEARITLENPAAEDRVAVAGPSPSWSRIVPWIVAAVCLLAAASLWLLYLRQTPYTQVAITAIVPPDGAAFNFFTIPSAPAISPDGGKLVFNAQSADGTTRLWVRPLNSPTAQPLMGTDNARFPFWSPDGRTIGFFAGGKLRTIDAAGGPPFTVADAPLGHGGSWSPRGVIMFSPNESGPLRRVSASGGSTTPASVLNPGEISHKFPWFLPDGRHFLFSSFQAPENVLEVGALDSKEVKIAARIDSNAIYADRHLLFLRERTLMAQPFDVNRFVTTGDAVPIAEEVGRVFVDSVGLFSAARTRILAYQSGTTTASIRLTWLDRGGKSLGTVAEPAEFTTVELSPDQRSVAASVNISGNRDIWIYDIARGLSNRFTSDPAPDTDAVWSPDGRSIAFRSTRRGYYDLYRKSADGAGAEELLYRDDLNKTPTSWSSDGKFLLYTAIGSQTAEDIWVLPLMSQHSGASSKPFPFLRTAFQESYARFSPDGRWVAYQSNESQRYEIYVAPFSGPGGKRRVSISGGTFPRWRRDGKEIFYVPPEGRLMAAEVNYSGKTFEVGQVRPFSIPAVRSATGQFLGYQYDVSADGQRFLVAAAAEQNAVPPLTLVQNWVAGLKK